jgi:hypothetical protein
MVLTATNEDLYLAALSRAHELRKVVPWDQLRPEEAQRIVLDAAVFALYWEWGPWENRDEALEYIAHHLVGFGPLRFFTPEFARYMERTYVP